MKKRVLVCLASAALAAAAFADGLPAGYTEVPYLKLNGQCRVKTGLAPASTGSMNRPLAYCIRLEKDVGRVMVGLKNRSGSLMWVKATAGA